MHGMAAAGHAQNMHARQGCSRPDINILLISRYEDNVPVHRVRTMSGHRGRVGTMAWSSHLLSSGSRDRNILQRDIRAPEDFQHKLLGHRSEVSSPGSMHAMRHILCIGKWLLAAIQVAEIHQIPTGHILLIVASLPSMCSRSLLLKW